MEKEKYQELSPEEVKKFEEENMTEKESEMSDERLMNHEAGINRSIVNRESLKEEHEEYQKRIKEFTLAEGTMTEEQRQMSQERENSLTRGEKIEMYNRLVKNIQDENVENGNFIKVVFSPYLGMDDEFGDFIGLDHEKLIITEMVIPDKRVYSSAGDEISLSVIDHIEKIGTTYDERSRFLDEYRKKF